MLQIILLLLSIAGALPDAIEGFKRLWDIINQITDSKTRVRLRVKARRVARSQICPVKKQVISQVACQSAFADLTAEAQSIVDAQI